MDELFEQTQLSFSAQDNGPVSTATGKDAIACCSRYRECSDAKVCLIPDAEYAKGCLYRKNLEAGTIFYRKNARNFSADEYTEIVRQVEALSPEARVVLDTLLIDMCEYNRARRHCVVRNQFIPELSQVGLFTFRPLTSYEFPPRKANGTFTGWEYSAMVSAIHAHPRYASLFQEACEQRKKAREPYQQELKAARERREKPEEARLEKLLTKDLPGETTKEFLYQWLKGDEGSPMRECLAEPYRKASLPPEKIGYAEMLYRSTLLPSYDSHVYPHSIWWESGMLSVVEMEDEDERRIKMSPGYSPEEKTSLLAQIQQARALRSEGRQKKREVIL